MSEPRRVWFNKTYSSVYNVIRLLRAPNTPLEFYVVCTHTHDEFVGFHVSHEFELEPAGLAEAAYVDYCLEFCIRRRIELFVPGKLARSLAKARDRFEREGVKLLLAAAPETMAHLEDKAAFYARLDPGLAASPRSLKVNTNDEFVAACQVLREAGLPVCFKPAFSTGGLGFHILDDNQNDVRNLFDGQTLRITSESATRILSQSERFRDLLVMEYLDGKEYSIDCLAAKGRLLRAVPRSKPTRLGGGQRLEDVPELVALAERLAKSFGLDALFNVQVRYAGNVPKVLEINARMSGGIYLACLSGLNLPAWAATLALKAGDPADIPQPRFGAVVHQQFHEFILRSG